MARTTSGFATVLIVLGLLAVASGAWAQPGGYETPTPGPFVTEVPSEPPTTQPSAPPTITPTVESEPPASGVPPVPTPPDGPASLAATGLGLAAILTGVALLLIVGMILVYGSRRDTH